jgi:hypothetical protein
LTHPFTEPEVGVATKLAATKSSPGTTALQPRGADAPRRSIAVIGDIVASRRVPDLERSQVQRQLEQLTDALNKRYRRAIAAGFLVTLGDEFQGVLKQAETIPDLVWDIETSLAGVDVRIAMGFGTLNPPFKRLALGMDGPAFHAARAGIETARKHRLHGGLFVGFGDVDDLVLNGFARLLRHQRHGLSRAQRATLDLLRQGVSQAAIAKQLRITRQAVSSRAKGAGWDAFSEGERAWRAALQHYDVSDDWATKPR